jgi:hypothetical protein
MKEHIYWNVITIVFILGLVYYVYSPYLLLDTKEGMDLLKQSKQSRMCGNLLIKEGTKIKLYNSNVARVPGVNPIVFDTLEEYAEFVEWLKSQNISCPVLALQEANDVQGNKTYTPHGDMSYIGAVSDDLIQSPYEGNGTTIVQPIIDASYDNPPYNIGDHQGYDPLNQQIGRITKLDIEQNDVIVNNKSPFATDPNWGGQAYTQQLVDKGVFDEDKVFVKK